MQRLRTPLIYLAGIATALAGVTAAQVFPSVSFPDVLREAFYTPSIDRFVRRGVVRGYEDGTFGPDNAVTRGQMAVILDRYDQRVVEPLRVELRELRKHLGLGQCGDAEVQVWEQCDDGNLDDGDGCSAECFSEVGADCAGGYQIGERFAAPDGCNACVCTLSGITCTEMACPVEGGEEPEAEEELCVSSGECAGGLVCTTDYGDCRRLCPEGAICPAVCAGVCVSPGSISNCGNGVCDRNEVPYYTESPILVRCPQDCAKQPTVCGNGVCEKGETGDRELDPYAEYCPGDCAGYLSACEHKKQEFSELSQIFRSCKVDRDCIVFEQSCPFVSCGVAVNGEGLSRLERQSRDIMSICRREGEPEVCASCAVVHASCENNRCVLKEG